MRNVNTSVYWNDRYANDNLNAPFIVKSHQNLYAQVCSYVFWRKHSRIIDFGCGVGPVPFLLKKRGFRFSNCKYVGIDFSSTSIAKAKEYCPSMETDVFDLRGPLPEKYIDAFELGVCVEVLEHIDDYKSVLINLCKSLVATGNAIVTVPAKKIHIESHIHVFDINAIKKEVNLYGFKCIDDMVVDKWLIMLLEKGKFN